MSPRPTPLLLALALLLPTAASAQRFTVPVDVGVGPAAFAFFGPVFEDQPLHTGLKLSVEAVLDKDWLKKNQRRVPAKYRKYAQRLDEVRISPSLLIPDALILSPKLRDTGMYGATWKPLSLGLPLTSSPARLSLGAGLLLTYAYLYSDTLPDTHFVRPGAEVGVDLELQLSKRFLVSLGWESAFYVPQELGGLGLPGRLRDGIFHVGQAYLQLHLRFPYTARL
ncbi:hypothetical protein [Corallococcus macrosporus]|uniref:Outer membrane protein beta-barrel domain-containing protein n=1 Tax=Myxococcus fulvus (strain ATCC BAA-855 / HW-1) TaxID=483219 RepID=F8CIJ9_MYXFH|nr:hypothetical protein [Corallococcus macrosporus]AEI65065.1 hypothetical protein LILAB_15810 [Corallococcus macrosporus]